MLGVLVAPILIGLIFAYVTPYIMHHIKVDRCLDSGGKYIYEKNECNREASKWVIVLK